MGWVKCSSALASGVPPADRQPALRPCRAGAAFLRTQHGHRPADACWADVPAVRDARLHEIKSCDILQPGPAALTDGVAQLHALFKAWAEAA